MVQVLEDLISREKLESSGWSILPPPEGEHFVFDFLFIFKAEERPFKKNTQNFHFFRAFSYANKSAGFQFSDSEFEL